VLVKVDAYFRVVYANQRLKRQKDRYPTGSCANRNRNRNRNSRKLTVEMSITGILASSSSSDSSSELESSSEELVSLGDADLLTLPSSRGIFAILALGGRLVP